MSQWVIYKIQAHLASSVVSGKGMWQGYGMKMTFEVDSRYQRTKLCALIHWFHIGFGIENQQLNILFRQMCLEKINFVKTAWPNGDFSSGM